MKNMVFFLLIINLRSKVKLYVGSKFVVILSFVIMKVGMVLSMFWMIGFLIR